MDIKNLGLDDDILKELNKNSGYNKGVEVEHEFKEKFKTLLPEEYSVKGVITGKIEKVKGELKITNEKKFTAQEYQEKNRSHYFFLRNLTQLRDIGKGNPYEQFLKVERLKKEEAEYELTEEGRVILMLSKHVDIFKKITIEMTKVIVEPYKPKSLDSLTEENIQDEDLKSLLGIEDNEMETETGL